MHCRGSASDIADCSESKETSVWSADIAGGGGVVSGYRAVANDVWTESEVETIRWQETAEQQVLCVNWEKRKVQNCVGADRAIVW